jgi:hypothetical protein
VLLDSETDSQTDNVYIFPLSACIDPIVLGALVRHASLGYIAWTGQAKQSRN